ncbi:MAG TPA: hypothetical protein VFD39_14040 [Trueperaceae bacterium]|nr:hypothetical protein [Trueperaceae bacterium]
MRRRADHDRGAGVWSGTVQPAVGDRVGVGGRVGVGRRVSGEQLDIDVGVAAARDLVEDRELQVVSGLVTAEMRLHRRSEAAAVAEAFPRPDHPPRLTVASAHDLRLTAAVAGRRSP